MGLFALFFCLSYGSADLLAGFVPYRISLPRLEWPFYPETAVIYLSVDLMLLLLFLRLPVDKLCRLVGALVSQTLTAVPIFILLPIAPITASEIEAPFVYHLADWINLDNNYFPSLHVSYATTCALSAGGVLWWTWAMAVSASTLLCHQHYLLDVAAGFLLALLWTAFWRSCRPLTWSLIELLRCSFRHPRYAVISFSLLVVRALSPQRGSRALLGFCYLQHIDDLLDGHLKGEREPEDPVREQIAFWRNGEFGSDPLDRVAENLYRRGIPKDKVIALLEEMIVDRMRVRENCLLTEERLLSHLTRTFELSLDLMLWAAGSDHRGKDAPALLPLLGWCSLYRDFEDDLRLGLVNLPVGHSQPDTAYEWLMEQTEIARRNYRVAELEISRLQPGNILFKLFHRSVKRYLQEANQNRLLALSMQVRGHGMGTCHGP